MKGCTDTFEPECTGSWCREWGFCEFSLSAMYEDSAEREEWIQELKKHGKSLPKGATAVWRKFLKQKRKEEELKKCRAIRK